MTTTQEDKITHRSFRCPDKVWDQVRARATSENIAHMTEVLNGLMVMYAEGRVDIPRYERTLVYPKQ